MLTHDNVIPPNYAIREIKKSRRRGVGYKPNFLHTTPKASFSLITVTKILAFRFLFFKSLIKTTTAYVFGISIFCKNNLYLL